MMEYGALRPTPTLGVTVSGTRDAAQPAPPAPAQPAVPQLTDPLGGAAPAPAGVSPAPAGLITLGDTGADACTDDSCLPQL